MGVCMPFRLLLLLVLCNQTNGMRHKARADSVAKGRNHVQEFSSSSAHNQITDQKIGPGIIGSLVASGCAFGGQMGITSFKAETSTLSNEEIRIVLDKMKEGIEVIRQKLKFKDEYFSKLAEKDFNLWTDRLVSRIESAVPTHMFDLGALDKYNRKVKTTWNQFIRNFYYEHHIVFLSQIGKDICSKSSVECANVSTPINVPDTLSMYQYPCEETLEGKCTPKKSLMVSRWIDALETRTCSATKTVCSCVEGEECVLIPGTDGEDIGFAEGLVQHKACQIANAASFETPDQAIRRMKHSDEMVANFDPFQGINLFGGAVPLSALVLVASSVSDMLGSAMFWQVAQQLTLAGATATYIVGLGINMASAMVCQVAVAKMLSWAPRPAQQVVVNVLQPVFSIARIIGSGASSLINGVSSEVLGFFGAGERKTELLSGECQPGQVQWGIRHLFEISNITKDACKAMCEEDESCYAYDYSKKYSDRGDGCRGVPWNHPRLDVPGYLDRVYCQVRTTAPTCAKEGENCTCFGKVRYGNHESWTEWQGVEGTILCNKESFHGKDPLWMRQKKCQCNGLTDESGLALLESMSTCLADREYLENYGYSNGNVTEFVDVQRIADSLTAGKDDFDAEEEKQLQFKEIGAWAMGSDWMWDLSQEESMCSEIKLNGHLYQKTVKLGGCRMKIEVIPGQREIFGGLHFTSQGLAPYERSHMIHCKDLNPRYKGSFYIRCFERGPNSGYQKLSWYVKTSCKLPHTPNGTWPDAVDETWPDLYPVMNFSAPSEEPRDDKAACPFQPGREVTLDLDSSLGVTLRIRHVEPKNSSKRVAPSARPHKEWIL